MQMLPFDDTYAEGPRATMKHFCRQAQNASFAGMASAARLDQNLADVTRLPREMDRRPDVKAEW